MIDVAIVGGGLAGGLIALALYRTRPELRITIFETGETLGGKHRWSWFASDVSEQGEALLSNIRKSEWDDGYAVRFPAYDRRLSTPYRSMTSEDFHAALKRELPKDTIQTSTRIDGMDAGGVGLASGEWIEARTVIDTRSFVPSEHLSGGWQVFMGRTIRCPKPHGVERPIIMDASVEQLGGYRFVYVLPLGSHEVFVEDTYYQDSPVLDRGALSGRLDRYCIGDGLEGDIVDGETGVLPVITGGDFATYQQSVQVEGVTLAGARGGFVHPLTSYTLPFAVATALEIAENADLTGHMMAAMMETRARQHWQATKFYRTLGKMLFGADAPEKRFRIFEHFYRRPLPLIERFYSGKSTFGDRMRILSGRPPVSVFGAIGALSGQGLPLTEGTAA